MLLAVPALAHPGDSQPPLLPSCLPTGLVNTDHHTPDTGRACVPWPLPPMTPR